MKASAEPSRAGVLGGWFEARASREVLQAAEGVGAAFGADRDVRLEGADIAQSAAFVFTGFEGGQGHRADLRDRPQEFDPAVRDRLLAGTLLPTTVGREALRYQAVFAEAARDCSSATMFFSRPRLRARRRGLERKPSS